MSDAKTGRQTPTVSHVLPYEDTRGMEAILLYDQSGRKAMKWQELMAADIMAVDEDGLWKHMKFGWSIPRRNGKSELLIMRAIWGLLHNERVLYTAHVVNTAHSAWEKISAMLSKMGFTENDDFKNLKNKGAEHIEWLRGEGVINFRTRTSKGGLGEGYDLLIIDEAQEYTVDQESALKYVVSDSKNPQTLMCGTPPTAVSAGTVFTKYRETVLSGKGVDSGWAEWGVDKLSDIQDTELWYETNPSLGTILTERTVRQELGDDHVDLNIQRLGLWILYSQKSAISKAEWQSYKLEQPPALPKKPRIYLGVKYGKDGVNVSAAVAVKTSDGKIFVEALDCRSVRDGNSWIIAYMQNPHFEKAAIDGANGQQLLVDEMKAAGVKCKAVLPQVKDVINANALFEQQLAADNIRHSGQASLEQIVSNCEHRAIRSDGGFGYRSILEEADVSLLEAVSLAHWLCASQKEKRVQKIYY